MMFMGYLVSTQSLAIDIVLGFGYSFSGGGYAGTGGPGDINSVSSVVGAEAGIDIEIGLYFGDAPPKGEHSVASTTWRTT